MPLTPFSAPFIQAPEHGNYAVIALLMRWTRTGVDFDIHNDT